MLAILHDRVQNMAGDPAAKTVYGALLEAAGKPYVAMLQMWTRTGRLVDPYEELCVKESKFIDRGTLDKDYTDEYWDRRYTVSVSMVGNDAASDGVYWLVERRVDLISPQHATAGWCSPAQDYERKTTRWGVRTATARELETQGVARGEVSECDSGVRYRRPTRQEYH